MARWGLIEKRIICGRKDKTACRRYQNVTQENSVKCWLLNIRGQGRSFVSAFCRDLCTSSSADFGTVLYAEHLSTDTGDTCQYKLDFILPEK